MKRERSKRKPAGQLFAEGTTVDEAVKAGAKDALRRHKLARQPLVGMRDGKIVWVAPDELEIQE